MMPLRALLLGLVLWALLFILVLRLSGNAQ